MRSQSFSNALGLGIGPMPNAGTIGSDASFEDAMCAGPFLPQSPATPAYFLSLRGVYRYTLRAAAANRKLDMSDAFEAYAGKSREANLGVMTKGRFQAAMSDIFKGVPQAALKIISREYGTGDPDRRDPGGFMQVRFKQFADDFDAIELRKTEGPSIEEMGEMIPLMAKLRLVATKQKLDLTDAFEVTKP